MICSIKFLNKRFANEVRNLVGNDDVKFYSYLGNAIENEDFKEAFKEWYKSKTGKIASLKDKYSFKVLAKAIHKLPIKCKFVKKKNLEVKGGE